MKKLTLLVAGMVMCGGALTASGLDWPTFHQNTALTGVTPDSGPLTNNIAWTFNTGAAVQASPVVVDGTLYVGNVAGKFYAVDVQTGQLKWWKQLPGAVHSTASVSNGVVYVLDETGKLQGMNAATGVALAGWPQQLGNGSWDWSSPATVDNNVYVADSTGQVHSRNAVSGVPNWVTQINGLILPGQPGGVVGAAPNSMTTVANGKVYAGTHNLNPNANNAPTLIALQQANGQVAWSYDYYLKHNNVAGMINANGAAVADGHMSNPGQEVYFGVFNWNGVGPTAVCLDEATGQELWAANINGNSSSTPAVHNGRVFIGSDDKALYCLDGTTGAQIWRFQTGDLVWESPVIADGRVYFGSRDHTVYCLDELGGGLIWSYNTGASRLEGSGCVVDGFYYTGNENGKIYAFGVPEPSGLALLALGAVGVLSRRRRSGRP